MLAQLREKRIEGCEEFTDHGSRLLENVHL
jgi:hypothetical protein